MTSTLAVTTFGASIGKR